MKKEKNKFELTEQKSKPGYATITISKYLYSVNPFGVEGVQVNLETRPNWFFRIWMRFFFNWRFIKI
ncbi:hypothetical protein KAI04_04215 [Candidatus Pacearchaeota archaeon]|nr:hypothetical protein [Candidatus Pacearchaeota archaeon]